MDELGRQVFYKPYFKDMVWLYNFSLELSTSAEIRLSLKGALVCKKLKQPVPNKYVTDFEEIPLVECDIQSQRFGWQLIVYVLV